MAVKITLKSICNRLYPNDPRVAQLLEEIVFWANKTTLVSSDGNPLIVYTLNEWGDLMGLSKRQVEWALGAIRHDEIVTTYSTRHPIKEGILRALHMEVDLVFLAMIENAVEGLCATDSTFDVPPLAHDACATISTPAMCYPTYIDNLTDNLTDMAMPSAIALEQPEKEKKFMAKMDDVLKEIKAKQEAGRYKNPETIKMKNSAEPIKLWREVHAEVYPGVMQGAFTNKEKAWFKALVKEYGAKATGKMVDAVIRQWEDFALVLHENKGLKFIAKYPDFKLVYTHRQIAVNFSEGQYAPKDLHSSAPKPVEKTEGAKKLEKLSKL